MKCLCPAGCGKKYISEQHAKAHADVEHAGWDDPKQRKSKGWATPHGFIDFMDPVTYEEACEIMEQVTAQFRKRELVS